MSQAKNLWKLAVLLLGIGVAVLFYGLSEHGQTMKTMTAIGLVFIVLGGVGMIGASYMARQERKAESRLPGNEGGVSIAGRGLDLDGGNVTIHGENVTDEQAREILEDVLGKQQKSSE